VQKHNYNVVKSLISQDTFIENMPPTPPTLPGVCYISYHNWLLRPWCHRSI